MNRFLWFFIIFLFLGTSLWAVEKETRIPANQTLGEEILVPGFGRIRSRSEYLGEPVNAGNYLTVEVLCEKEVKWKTVVLFNACAINMNSLSFDREEHSIKVTYSNATLQDIAESSDPAVVSANKDHCSSDPHTKKWSLADICSKK